MISLTTIGDHKLKLIKCFVLGLLVACPLAFAAPDIQVNINTATAEEIADVLDGVGVRRAEAIVEYREQFGQFESADDLVAVRGIGDHVLETNKDRIITQ